MNMKSLITSALLLLALLLPAPATAYSFKYGGVDYTITGANTVEVSTRQQTDPEYHGDVAIPATIDHKGINFTVTAISDWAFWNCKDLMSVNIPSSVTCIGEAAFRDCSGLTSVNIPNSVTIIGERAFLNCSSLKSVTIPNTISTIGEMVFSGCSSLTSVTIPSSVTSIGRAAFYDCSGLTSVSIPNTVTSIGSGVFSYCNGLMDVYSYITDLSGVSVEREAFLFDGDYSGRRLHVPQGTAAAYQADNHWYPYFGQIVEDLKPEHLPGDVNGDDEVNIADVNAVINIILEGNNPVVEADVNNDSEVNIADINAIIDIILAG